MPLVDIAITVIIILSIVVGLFRGFVKEALSIAALLLAIWAALNFGDDVGELASGWLSSDELRVWFGGILVFVVIVTLGGLISWGVGKLVRLSVLSGTDRALGAVFGFCRGTVLVALIVMAGQFSGFEDEDWWRRSALIPYAEVVADWLRVMAPKGLELLRENGTGAELPVELSLP